MNKKYLEFDAKKPIEFKNSIAVCPGVWFYAEKNGLNFAVCFKGENLYREFKEFNVPYELIKKYIS